MWSQQLALAHTPCLRVDSSSALPTFKVRLGNPTGSPPAPGRIYEAPPLVLPSFTSQGIATQRAESRAPRKGGGESQDGVVPGVGAQLTEGKRGEEGGDDAAGTQQLHLCHI